MSRKLLAAIVGGASALCLATLAVTPSARAGTAAVDPGSDSRTALPAGMSMVTYRQMLQEVPLDDAATRIRAAVGNPGAGHDGFVQIGIDADHHALTVYWHGTVPPDIARLFSSLGGGVHVVVQHSAYSVKELRQAAHDVLNHRTGLQVTNVGPAPDGSGIIVGVSGTKPSISGNGSLGTSVAVQFQSLTLHQQSRDHDLPLFWGGAVVNGPKGQCTSGFGVHTANNVPYLATAAHCASGSTTYKFTNGDATATIGPMTGQIPDRDEGLIRTASGNAYYDGPSVLAGDTQRYKVVAGQAPLNYHQSVCQSGAFGGVHCGLIVQRTNVDNVETSSGTVVDGVTLTSLAADGSLTQYGDSGAPVFSLAPNNKVTAGGIILGWVVDSRGNLFEGVMPISSFTSDFGVTVNTG